MRKQNNSYLTIMLIVVGLTMSIIGGVAIPLVASNLMLEVTMLCFGMVFTGWGCVIGVFGGKEK